MIKISKDKLCDLIKKHKYTIVLFLIIFIFSLIFRTKTNSLSFLKDIFFSLLGTSLIYVLLDLFIALRLRWVGVAFLSVLITADLSLFYLYRTPMNYGIIASIFETNLDEVVSMSQGLWLSVLFSLTLSVFLLVKSTKEMKKTTRIPIVWAGIYLLLNIGVVPVATGMISRKDSFTKVYERAKNWPFMWISTQISPKYPFIIGDFTFMIAYADEIRSFSQYVQTVKELPSGIKYDKTRKKPTKIVLIIGESARRDHMSVYGYGLKTTPFLDSLAVSTDKLVLFDSIISPAALTRDAIRLSMSYATPQDEDPFWGNKNLIDLANDAGYNTIWISGQEIAGIYNSYVARISASAKELVFGKQISQLSSRSSDLDLIPSLRSFLENGEAQFIAMHIQGSHLSYSTKCDDIDTQALGSVGETIDYDKTIHHTDRFLAQVYQTLKSQSDDFLILYYSDHAEVINTGHGILNRYKDQYKIPLVVISDSLTSERYSAYVNKYYNDKTNRLSSSNLIYFLGEIMGYSVANSLIEKAKKATDDIFQVDGAVKRYSEIKD